MKHSLFAIITLCLIIQSCSTDNKGKSISIYPLHPYRQIQDFKNDNGQFISRAIVDYYVVYGDISDTAKLRKLLINYASNHFDRSVMKRPLRYEIHFYKHSDKTNKEYKESHFDLIDYHVNDYLANVNYYEDGNHDLLFIQH